MSKDGWTTVKFGDVVENIRRNIKDREAAGIDRVLGLDDIEAGNLHVTGWKDVDSSPSFRTHFKPGQTLFGKRRAYLRKVAYAEFEGVCTQNILVFETKDPDVLLPELLPFICMSEAFVRDAIKHSTGSLFPNANWKATRDYEFNLPPIDIQKSLVEFFWLFDKYNIILEHILTYLENIDQKIFFRIMNESDAIPYTIKQLLDEGYFIVHKDGNHGSDYPRKAEFGTTGVPFISANCFTEMGELIKSKIKLLDEKKANNLKHGWIENYDVLLSHNASVGKVALYDGRFEKAIVGTSLTAFRCDQTRIKPHFLYTSLKSTDFQYQLKKMMVQSTRNQVPITTQRKLTINIPSLAVQERISTINMNISSLRKQFVENLNVSRNFYSFLISNIHLFNIENQ